jgi:DNA-binding NarL/FixJ family response regulator
VTGRRILVVDDHALVHVGLRALLTQQPWVGRCLAAGDAHQALHLCRTYSPHVALVDLFIGETMGVQLCRQLCEIQPDLRVLLMSGTGQVSAAVARSAGAQGFMSKEWSAEAAVAAVLRVAEGQAVFSRGPETAPHTPLSRRETDVLVRMASGETNEEIAETLFLSRHTVKQHTSAIYRKLGVRKRIEAVRRAERLGLLT